MTKLKLVATASLALLILKGATMAAKRADSKAVSGPPRLFDVSADPRKLQTFRVEGLARPASGTVYPATGLEQGGMPLGGIGTGYVCLDPDGRLGKSSMFNISSVSPLNRTLLFLTVGKRRLTLAAPKGGRGDAKAVHYFGHFPVADVRFDLDVPLRVELRALSPFLPGDAAASNTPAAVFEVHLTNLADKPLRATVDFSPGGLPSGKAERFAPAGWAGVQVGHYAIAAESGTVGSRGKAAQVSVRCDLKAGERKVARFVLAWHQPHVREASSRVERLIYADRFADAKAVAAHAAARHAQWLARILAWQGVLYGSDLPDWLKETLVNAPYALTKNSAWLARTRPDDWWGDEGLFLVNESFSTCSLTETMPCRFFGHWPALLFFPELELTTLKAIRHFQLRDGQPPFCMGMGFAIRDPRYHCQHTCGAGEYAQMIYRYWLRTADRKFLKDFWPSARDAIGFMLYLDRDGDGLVEDHPHTVEGQSFPANNPMDQWPWYGPGSYTAGKALGALVCGIKLAELAGDRKQAAAWREALKKGRKAYDEKLWTGSYYRTYAGAGKHKANDSCLSSQLSSVWCTRVLGLADPLPAERIAKALDAITKLNVPASRFGMVNAVFADGKVCTESRWANDIFIQCNATAAMVYLYVGRRAEGERAARAMLDTIFRGPHAMPWSQPCGISSATGGTCHGHDYYDHMVVWSYPLAFARQDIRAACAPGGLVARLLDAAAAR